MKYLALFVLSEISDTKVIPKDSVLKLFVM
jgi:hypothetical protein